MRYKLITVIGLCGSALASFMGGWDMALKTLVTFMVIDWITGGISLPGVFGKSPKSYQETSNVKQKRVGKILLFFNGRLIDRNIGRKILYD